MKRVCIAVLLLLLLAVPAFAKTNITLPTGFTQQEFKDLSTDLGLAVSYMPLAPAEPLGRGVLPGFDIGVEVTGVEIDNNRSYWQKVETASGGSVPSTLVFPKLHVQVGLPIVPIDLGIVYGEAPNTNVKMTGYEIKWAILRGGVAMPAIALRGAYTQLSGVSDFDITTTSADLSISKGFAIFTPYAGYGMVWIDSKPSSPLNPTLKEEKLDESKWFVGFRLTFFPFMNMVAEADFAQVNAYSLRLNVHF
jgi:hypothetical protein